jgi:hypothetical protein
MRARYITLELKENFLFERKNVLMIVSYGKNCLKFILYFIIFFQCIYSSINRPFLTKNNYSSQGPLYYFYMKYSVIEKRWEKYSKSLTTRVKTLRLMQYWWKQDWTMFCCPHCSQLSTILNNIVTPDSGSTILFNIVDKCEQRTWAAKHCPVLLSTRQKTPSPLLNRIEQCFAA